MVEQIRKVLEKSRHNVLSIESVRKLEEIEELSTKLQGRLK